MRTEMAKVVGLYRMDPLHGRFVVFWVKISRLFEAPDGQAVVPLFAADLALLFHRGEMVVGGMPVHLGAVCDLIR